MCKLLLPHPRHIVCIVTTKAAGISGGAAAECWTERAGCILILPLVVERSTNPSHTQLHWVYYYLAKPYEPEKGVCQPSMCCSCEQLVFVICVLHPPPPVAALLKYMGTEEYGTKVLRSCLVCVGVMSCIILFGCGCMHTDTEMHNHIWS